MDTLKRIVFETEINGHQWLIEEKSCDEIKGRLESSGMCFGLCEYPERRITIAEDVSTAQKMQTLRHELIHAFIFAYGFIYFEKFNHEQMADFYSLYGEEIERIVRSYFD